MKKVIILASGEGTTCEFLLEQQKLGQLNIFVQAIIVDRNCGVLNVAKAYNIPSALIVPFKGMDSHLWDQKIWQFIKAADPDFVLTLGFLRKLGPKVVKGLQNKIINSHPSLLPAYGGKGMYGSNIHKKIIANKEPKTGVTIHYINENYDEGQIINQKEIKVMPGETAEHLEERVKQIEKGFLIETLQKIFN
ncbi:MAG: hypothetical protein KDD58_06175 [Bdellovibrionales bacterium]|nr:hypothetical protein [Bdellovibrionales bacterium]